MKPQTYLLVQQRNENLRNLDSKCDCTCATGPHDYQLNFHTNCMTSRTANGFRAQLVKKYTGLMEFFRLSFRYSISKAHNCDHISSEDASFYSLHLSYAALNTHLFTLTCTQEAVKVKAT